MDNTNSDVTNQAIKLKKEKIIKGITCPSCSGELDIRDGMHSFNCKYCGTLLVVKGDKGVLKYYVPRKLKRDDAIERAYKWLGEGLSKAKGLKANSQVTEAFLVYIPYWRVRADVVGWVFGVEKRTVTTSSGTRTEYEHKEVKIQKSFDKTLPACDVAELGVRKVNLMGDQILPVNYEALQQDGMVFNIVSSQKDVLENSLNLFKSQARKEVNLDEITFEHYDLVRENISIVYYPLWIVRYIFNNRTYQIVIDGEDGSVCYGKAPGSNLFRAITGILGLALGMYLATFFEIFAIIRTSDKTPWIIYGLCLLFGIFLISYSYKKFRYGGEIEEGTGLEKEDSKESIFQSAGILKSSNTQEGIKNIISGTIGSSVAGGILGSILNKKDNYQI